MHVSIRRSLLIIALTLPALACGEALGPNGEKLVKVADNSFDPASKTIKVGEKVLWEWSGVAQHNVTWVAPSGTGNSATQASGTYTRDFSAAGTFDYFCSLHGTATAGMRGTIVVQ